MWGRSIIAPCALLLSASMALGQTKFSTDLVNVRNSGQVHVIVQFKKNPTSELHKRVLRFGGSLTRQYRILKSGAYTIPTSILPLLEADPDVAYVTLDRPVHMTGVTSTITSIASPLNIVASQALTLDHHRETIDLPPAAMGLNGTGIGVAVIDSGIAPVADLNNVVYSQDFTNSGSPADQYGHGTHVAGIIAGNGASSTGSQYTYTVKGIAQNVNLVNLRVLDQNGAGNDSELIAAIDTAIQLQSKYNIRVINLSVGRGVFESYTQDPLCQAVEEAWKAGIVVVSAAGNYGRDNAAGTNGYGTIISPGNDPYVITVGAMNTLGTPNRCR